MKIALDWTPNVMHSGLYIAKGKGWIDLEFISPSVDDYAVMPSEKVISGEAEFSIGPPESLIHHHLENEQTQLLTLGPILHKNTSVFAALEKKNIRTLRDWSGKTYAALGIAYEEALVQQILQQGGNIPMHFSHPLKLDTWKMLQAGETDLTWIFLPVEGAEATYKDIGLTIFRPEDFGIPYPACPLIYTSRNFAEAVPDAVIQFMKAVQKGYQYAVDYPEEAVMYLRKGSENNWIEDGRLLLHCQKAINPFFLDKDKKWGRLQETSLSAYVNWLFDNQIITRKPDVEKMVYKSALPAGI